MRFSSLLFSGSLLSTTSVAFAQSNWTWRNPLPQGNTLHSVIWTGGQLLAVGAGGAVLQSPDGIAWNYQNSGMPANHLYSVAWSGTQFVPEFLRVQEMPLVDVRMVPYRPTAANMAPVQVTE